MNPLKRKKLHRTELVKKQETKLNTNTVEEKVLQKEESSAASLPIVETAVAPVVAEVTIEQAISEQSTSETKPSESLALENKKDKKRKFSSQDV